VAGADDPHEAVRRSFDRIAEQYAADFSGELARKPFDRERLRSFAAGCALGPVLDVGCGAAGHVGRFVADAIGQPPRVIGVDVSERSVALARRLNPPLGFVAADMRALPLRPGVCGAIVAFYSLIYGDDAHVAASLGEFRRVLRPGAPLLVAVHAGEGAQHFDEYRGLAVDVTMCLRRPESFAAQVRGARFGIDTVEVRPPYELEHPTERLYVAAHAI